MLIIKDDKGNQRYGVAPISKDESWLQLYKWRESRVADKGGRNYTAGDTIPEAWIALQCYPHNLPHALRLIGEKFIADKITPEIGLADALKQITTALNNLNTYEEANVNDSTI